MKISIITVCYNSEKTIEETILSVVNQNYTNIEYIIIDGNSNDNTKKIINKYINYITYYISEPDNGIYDAMNKGLKIATGEIVAILNSDDLYFDNYIIKMICDTFNANPNLDILYGNLVYVKTNNIYQNVRYWKSKSYYNNYFEDCNVPPHPTLILKKSIYNQIGVFNTIYLLASDYDLIFRLFKLNKFTSYYLDKTFVKMRLGGVTNKNIYNIIKGNLEILRIWKSHGTNPPRTFLLHKVLKRLTQYFINE